MILVHFNYTNILIGMCDGILEDFEQDPPLH